MSDEPLIHREAPSDVAWLESDEQRGTLKERILEIVTMNDQGPHPGVILDEIKSALRVQGDKSHHGSVSAAIHGLEAEGAIVQKGSDTRGGKDGKPQRVLVLRTDGVVPDIRRPKPPDVERVEAALVALRREWARLAGWLEPEEQADVGDALAYLRDLSAWRRRRTLRSKGASDA